MERKGQITVLFQSPMKVPEQSVIDSMYSSGKVKFVVRPLQTLSNVEKLRNLEDIAFNSQGLGNTAAIEDESFENEAE